MWYSLNSSAASTPVSEYDLDLVAAAHVAANSHQAPPDVSATVAAATQSALSSLLAGRTPKSNASLDSLRATLSATGLIHDVNRRVEQCQKWRGTMEEIKKDRDAWTLMSCTSHTPHQIIPGLWLGGFYTAADDAALQQMGVTHILSCIDTEHRFPGRYTYCTFPMDDNASFDPTPYFRDTIRFIDNALTSGGTVFVHCGAGMSRAPTVVAAFLMKTFGLSSIQSLDLVKRVRPCVYPNKGFLQHLATYGQTLASNDVPTVQCIQA